MSVAVEFRDVVKDFGPVRVLHGISFSLQAGRSYGLLGENGAGKSTLMKILSGFECATSGELRVNGRAMGFDNSRAAEDQGIVLIHQEFSLAEHLTIAQNLFLGHEKKRGWLLDDAAMQKDAAVVLAQVELNVDVNTRVRHLIVAEKQLVAIARALLRRARMLIMDAPTATLTPGETEHRLQRATQRGMGRQPHGPRAWRHRKRGVLQTAGFRTGARRVRCRVRASTALRARDADKGMASWLRR